MKTALILFSMMLSMQAIAGVGTRGGGQERVSYMEFAVCEGEKPTSDDDYKVLCEIESGCMYESLCSADDELDHQK